MLCPLRLGIKEPCMKLDDVGFGECYKEKCEWWIPDNVVDIGGRCAICCLGTYSLLRINEEE